MPNITQESTQKKVINGEATEKIVEHDTKPHTRIRKYQTRSTNQIRNGKTQIRSMSVIDQKLQYGSPEAVIDNLDATTITTVSESDVKKHRTKSSSALSSLATLHSLNGARLSSLNNVAIKSRNSSTCGISSDQSGQNDKRESNSSIEENSFLRQKKPSSMKLINPNICLLSNRRSLGALEAVLKPSPEVTDIEFPSKDNDRLMITHF